MEVRLLSIGARGLFLATSRLAFTALPLNSVAPNEKKTSSTQGNPYNVIFKDHYCQNYINILSIVWNLQTALKILILIVTIVTESTAKILMHKEKIMPLAILLITTIPVKRRCHIKRPPFLLLHVTIYQNFMVS